ncbi:MAG: metallophosphoesterase [Anaerolineaceae bacterium]
MDWINNRLLLATIFLFLSGCTSSPVSSTSIPSPIPTLTPQPTLTHTPLPTPTGHPTHTPTPEPFLLIGAGDIAYCGEDSLGDEATSAILERFPSAAIFTAGDNVSGVGRLAEYRNCFGPTWGRFLDRLHPVPGNHDLETDGGAPYYAYFGEVAGQTGQGFYSYNLGDWHIAALNSNCDAIACGPNSAQARWLREDLTANGSQCTLLYWHHPRYSSGLSGNYGLVSSFWRIALEYGADVVVSGHDHGYERFAPQDGDDLADPDGIRQFVVGTGGSELREFGEVKPNSEVRDNSTHGVILFRLFPGRYEWEFLPVEGGTFTDKGEGKCSH